MGNTGTAGKSEEFKAAMIAYYRAPNSTLATARHFGMAYGGARKILVKAGVLRTERYGALAKEVIDEMLARWASGDSQTTIGKALGISQLKVSRLLVQNGVVTERRNKGEQHGAWKGGVHVSGGYRRVFIPINDPLRQHADASGYMLEHRLVVARWLGRALDPSETVHHIDGDSMNNDLKNLQLRQGKHGRGACMHCLECGSARVGFTPISTAD